MQTLLWTIHAFWNNKILNHQKTSQKTSSQTHKLFHKIPWFFNDFSVFFKFHDFSMHETFFFDFPGFPVLLGTLLMENGSLMKVESIAECSPWSILQYFWPALSNNQYSENQFLVFFLSGHLRQVLLYKIITFLACPDNLCKQFSPNCNTLMVFWEEFRKSWFWKIQHSTKMHEKLPRKQRV